MSLAVSSICLFKHGMSTDITNIIGAYVGTHTTSRWIPYYDTNGVIRRKLNKPMFQKLADIYAYKHAIINQWRTTQNSICLNGTQSYSTADITLIAPKLTSRENEIEAVLYISLETSTNVFSYLIMQCVWVIENDVCRFARYTNGWLHRPTIVPNCMFENRVTSFGAGVYELHIQHTDVSVSMLWDDERLVYDYYFTDNTLPYTIPFPPGVYDVEHIAEQVDL